MGACIIKKRVQYHIDDTDPNYISVRSSARREEKKKRENQNNKRAETKEKKWWHVLKCKMRLDENQVSYDL